MATAARKRPWYLVLALLGALALGSSGASTGWARMVLYRQPINPSFESDDITDQAEREAIIARTRTWLQALDNAKPRGWPLGVASLVLGGAVFVFAMRTLGGSSSARTALVQLVAVQAALGVVDYCLLRDVWDLTARLEGARMAALAHQHFDPAMVRQSALSMPIAVALQTLGSALVIVGLTRRRSRGFFETRTEALGEP